MKGQAALARSLAFALINIDKGGFSDVDATAYNFNPHPDRLSS
jgi:hypothetical protein